jgi:DNA-binding MarR family transcriptional regulator
MAENPDPGNIARALMASIGLLVRRARQAKSEGELSVPEIAALARLDRGGPATSAALAKLEGISPQSMGATLGGLEARGFVERRPDPADGRQSVVSLGETGRELLRNGRTARAEQMARALSSSFTTAELQQLAAAAPLLERLAQQF